MHFANFAHRTSKPKLTNSTRHLTTNDASNFFWFPDNHLLNFWKGRDAVAIGLCLGVVGSSIMLIITNLSRTQHFATRKKKKRKTQKS